MKLPGVKIIGATLVTLAGTAALIAGGVYVQDQSAAPPVFQCNDTLDNDGDLLIDFPNDPGCTSALDDDESNAPPPTGTCLISNRTTWTWDECSFGTVINASPNTSWSCNQPLSSYGPLPIKVVHTSTISWNGNAITLDNGCVGDNIDNTIDLILDIQAGGLSSGEGPQDDSAKTRLSPGPQDIQVTGRFECGAPAGGSHPDAWQFQGGGGYLAVVNGVSGNYNAGLSTCQTAGGAIFYSSGAASQAPRIDILGGEYIGCNHGLNGNSSASNLGAGSVIQDVKFRTGRNNDGDPNCNFSSSDPCINTGHLVISTGVVCQRWNAVSDTWVNVPPSA